MAQKQLPEDNPEEKSRTEQAREVAEEYANDQREILKKLPVPDRPEDPAFGPHIRPGPPRGGE